MAEREELDHESKFRLPAAATDLALQLVRTWARPELPHASGVVESIYFDTRALRALAEKSDSDYRKSKLRLRWYDGGGPVFVELKRRVGTRRVKRRAPLALRGEGLTLARLLAEGGPTPADLARALGEPLAADLMPILHLRYRRERFVAPDELRLCVDRELEVIAATWLAGGRRVPVRLPGGVLELKGKRRELPPALATLAAFGCRRGSFSKYAACHAALAV
jgi:hypothetical protein